VQGDNPKMSNFIHVSTCATAGDVISLFGITEDKAFYTVVNKGAETLAIYPPSTWEIDSLGVNTAYSLASGASINFLTSLTDKKLISF